MHILQKLLNKKSPVSWHDQKICTLESLVDQINTIWHAIYSQGWTTREICYIYGLVECCSIFSALTMEILESCTKQPISFNWIFSKSNCSTLRLYHDYRFNVYLKWFIIRNPEPHAEVEILWFLQIANLSFFMETAKWITFVGKFTMGIKPPSHAVW